MVEKLAVRPLWYSECQDDWRTLVSANGANAARERSGSRTSQLGTPHNPAVNEHPDTYAGKGNSLKPICITTAGNQYSPFQYQICWNKYCILVNRYSRFQHLDVWKQVPHCGNTRDQHVNSLLQTDFDLVLERTEYSLYNTWNIARMVSLVWFPTVAGRCITINLLLLPICPFASIMWLPSLVSWWVYRFLTTHKNIWS